MSISIGEEKSKITVYKDEQGRYKTYIKRVEKDIKQETTTKEKPEETKK